VGVLLPDPREPKNELSLPGSAAGVGAMIALLLLRPLLADAVRYIDALSAYVWFALALVVFLLLYPTLKGIIRTRPFTIKVGSMELNVQ
jgi:uncharacterized membrane protein